MDIILRVDPEILDGEASRIDQLAMDFSGMLNDRQSAVAAIIGGDWQGSAGRAFGELFDQTRTELRDVEERIHAIASLLRAAKDGLITADEQTAAGLRA